MPVFDVARCATSTVNYYVLRPSGALADCASCLALLAIIRPPQSCVPLTAHDGVVTVGGI